MLYSFWENENKKQRTFTTEELTEMFNTTPAYINLLKRKLEIKCKIVIYGGAKHNVFMYSDYCQFKNYYDIKKTKGIVRECDLREIKKDFEDDTNSSQLIKDKRCYNLSWWPDIIPSNLADVWEA